MFHISILKLFRGKVVFQARDLPVENSISKPVEFLMALCATWTVFSHGVPLRQVLIQWEGGTLEEATWEPFDELCRAYPTFHLEDKVIFEGGENDTTISFPLQLSHDTHTAPAVEVHDPPDEVAKKVREEAKEIGPLERPKRAIKIPKKLNDSV